MLINFHNRSIYLIHSYLLSIEFKIYSNIDLKYLNHHPFYILRDNQEEYIERIDAYDKRLNINNN